MTPEEKAMELVDKFLCVDDNEDLFCDECGMSEKAAKLCALIAVNYLMKESETMTSLDYWFNVKTEIQKL